MNTEVRPLTLLVLTFSTLVGCGSNPASQSKVLPQGNPGCEGSAMTNQFVVQWEDGHVTVERPKNREHFLNDFVQKNIEKIHRVEYDHKVRLFSAPKAQVTSDSPTPDWGQVAVGAPSLWNQGVNGSGIVVAIIDTGTDLTHPQLVPSIYTNTNEIPGDDVDNDGNGYVDDVHGWNFVGKNNIPMDDNGHGSHVSGIIAANHSAGPAKGVAPGSKIIPLKMMDFEGSGYLSDAVLAIDYAVSAGARVINASWGGPQCLRALEDSIADLASKGVIFVAASGNEGYNLETFPIFPASFNAETQITVAASTYRGFFAGFSNYGSAVHMLAPGADIFSTWLSTKQTHAWLDGTSMAAPFVSASAALLFSGKPDATAQQVKSALLDGVTKGFCCTATSGEVNVQKSAQILGIL